jgi:hypothetical protein
MHSLRKKQHSSSGTGRIHGGSDQIISAYRQNDRVRPSTVRKLARVLNWILARCIKFTL